MPTATAELTRQTVGRRRRRRSLRSTRSTLRGGIGTRRSSATTRGGAVERSTFLAFRLAFGLVVAFGAVRFLARGWVGVALRRARAPPDVLPASTGCVRCQGRRCTLLVGALAVLGIAHRRRRRHTRLWRAACSLVRLRVRRADRRGALPQPLLVRHAGRGDRPRGASPMPRVDGTVPVVSVWALRAQLAVSSTLFAGLAKVNPDWLFAAQPMRHVAGESRTDRPARRCRWLDEPVHGARC